MNLKELKSAFNVAFSEKSLLIKGSLFSARIPLLGFITNPIAFGYTFRVGAGMMRGEKKLPEWKNRERLWVDFFVVSFVSLLYMAIVFFILLGIKQIAPGSTFENFGFPLLEGFISDSKTSLDFSKITLLEKIVVTLIFTPFFYILPAAGINWFASRKLRNSFDFDLIWRRAFRREYFMASIVTSAAAFFMPFLFWIFSSIFSSFNEKSLSEVIKSSFSESSLIFLLLLVLSLIFMGAVSYLVSLFGMIVCGRALRKIDKEDFGKNENKAKVLYSAELDITRPTQN